MNQDKIQKEILESLPSHPHGRLLLSPRIGKSKLIIELIKRDKPISILWVTPSTELAQTDIPNEFDKWRAKKYKERLTTVTYASLNKVSGRYELIVLDEDQCVTENNLKPLLDGSIVYRNIIGMTGTDTTHMEKKQLYDALNLPILYEYTIDEAVSSEILSDYNIYVIDVQMDTNRNIPIKTKKGTTFFTSELSNYDYCNRAVERVKLYGGNMKVAALKRMRAIHNSPSKEAVAKWLSVHLEGRTLVFAPTINQIERITPYVYHSKTNDESYQRFQNEEIDVLGLVQSGGMGYTFKNLQNIIMMQTDSDGTGKSTQKICRVLLREKDKTANIFILRLMQTKDVDWVDSTLTSFDETKINYLTVEQLMERYGKA